MSTTSAHAHSHLPTLSREELACAVAVTLVGALRVAVPFTLNMPHKASYADTRNDNLKPVYSQEMLTQANASLTTLSAMGTEMRRRCCPTWQPS